MVFEIERRARATAGSDSQQDPFPCASRAGGTFRGRNLDARRRFDCLVDQRPGAFTAIGCSHVDLKFSWNIVGFETVGGGNASLLCDESQSFGAVGEFTTGARNRQGKGHDSTCDGLVVVILDSYYRIVRNSLTNAAGSAFPFDDDNVNTGRCGLREYRWDKSIDAEQKGESQRQQAFPEITIHVLGHS